jgi:hypothetical protein
VAHYSELVLCIKKVYRSIYSVVTSAQALRKALDEMISQQEDVQTYIKIFSFMSHYLFEVTDKAITAMTQASFALHT